MIGDDALFHGHVSFSQLLFIYGLVVKSSAVEFLYVGEVHWN